MPRSDSLYTIFASTPADTAALGARLAARLERGDVVFLIGPLGAGKTTFARGVVLGWTGAHEDAPSPTYTLVQTYEGAKGALWHIDLYRLDDPDEALELGLEDALETAVTLIEWPERLGPHTPRERIEIRLTPRGDARMIEISGTGRHEGVRFDA